MSNQQHEEFVEPEEQGQQLDIEYATENQLSQSDIIDEIPELSVTNQMLREDSTRTDSWLQYNKGLEQLGYSPADRLTPDTVGEITGEYTIKMETSGLRASPIIVPSDPPVMYFTEPDATIHAVNARTGKEYWAAQPKLESKSTGIVGMHKGVGVWKDMVYLATPSTEVIAYDRYTGKQRWRTELLTEEQKQMSKPERISIMQAPVTFDGMVLSGQSGDYGGWSAVFGMDATSGDVQWSHRTTPKEQWIGDSWRFAGGSAWMSPAVDPDSGSVVWSIGNPDPMMNGTVRPGPNKYTVSIGSWDAKTGERNWITQVRAHDLWDYDMFTTPRIYEKTIDGETRKLVSAEDKTGWTYAFDMEDGRLVQRSEAFAEQDHTWGTNFPAYPPCRKENREQMWPGVYGGTEWPPDTYSPKTGLEYFGANNAAQSAYYNPDWEYEPDNVNLTTGGGYLPIRDNHHTAEVVAVDPVTGDVKWAHRLQDVDPSQAMASMYTGGTTATGGNVVLHGSSSGHLVALHAETGELLGRAGLGSRIKSAPVVWDDPAVNKQFITVAADDAYYTYSIGGS